jgi:hypothetical protein
MAGQPNCNRGEDFLTRDKFDSVAFKHKKAPDDAGAFELLT